MRYGNGDAIVQHIIQIKNEIMININLACKDWQLES